MPRPTALLLCVLAFCWLSSWSTAQAQAQASDVIIVGSGIAGISCARTLLAGGVKRVIILEARSRKGGRLITDKIGGYPIDLGGQWVQGTKGNPLTALARSFRLPTVPSDESDTTWFSDTGRRLPAAWYPIIYQKLEEFSNYLQELRYSGALTAANNLQQVWDAWPGRRGLELDALRVLRAAVYAMVETEYAASLRSLSALYYDQDSGLEGGDLLWRQGYSSLIDKLATGLNIRYGKVVTSVDYSSSPVKVTTADGTVYTAPYVVSTLPLGVLQSSSAPKFIPAFTGAKANAIAKLGVGLLNKVVVCFPSAFWSKNVTTQWMNRASATIGDVSSIFSLNRQLGYPVLVVFLAGDSAAAQERRTDAQIMAGVTAKLKAMFPDTYQAPTAYKITRWGRDRFSLGSYAYIKAGAPRDAYSSLAAPLNNRLFFAGEATSQEFPATAHGAYLSGQRAAEEILALRRRW